MAMQRSVERASRSASPAEKRPSRLLRPTAVRSSPVRLPSQACTRHLSPGRRIIAPMMRHSATRTARRAITTAPLCPICVSGRYHATNAYEPRLAPVNSRLSEVNVHRPSCIARSVRLSVSAWRTLCATKKSTAASECRATNWEYQHGTGLRDTETHARSESERSGESTLSTMATRRAARTRYTTAALTARTGTRIRSLGRVPKMAHTAPGSTHT